MSEVDASGHERSMLKPFQEATVEHAFARLYPEACGGRAEDQAQHFLVADEVGLGKTMVAKGVIARAVEYLRAKKTKRIDIVYLCASQTIARQNLPKLVAALSEEEAEMAKDADRLTLLAKQIGKLDPKTVNFFSLTPGTSFDMGRSMGKAEERRFLYWFLAKTLHGNSTCLQPGNGLRSGNPLMRMLKGSGSKKTDAAWYREIRDDKPARSAVGKFPREKREDILSTGGLKETFLDLGRRYPPKNKLPDGISEEVRKAVRELREAVALASIDLLEPDLIVMDEFQRFTDLLDGPGEDDMKVRIVRRMMEARDADTGEPVRALLLSATPYRQLTVPADPDESDAAHLNAAAGAEDAGLDGEDGSAPPPAERDHRHDFEGTLRILFGKDSTAVRDVRDQLDRLRTAMEELPAGMASGAAARDAARAILLQRIARTERVDTNAHRDSMVEEVEATVDLRPEDLEDARDLIALAHAAGARRPVEFWKSAPYLLNFMHGYKLLDAIAAARGKFDARGPLETLAKRSVTPARLDGKVPIEARNGRLRALRRYAFEGRDTDAAIGAADAATGWVGKRSGEPSVLAGRVWMPPTLPYLGDLPERTADGVEVADGARAAVSKALVFSSWQVVPDAVAALLSHEAEVKASVNGRRYADARRVEDSGEGKARILSHVSPTLVSLVDPMRLRYAEGAAALKQQREAVKTALQDWAKARGMVQVGPVKLWNAILEADGRASGEIDLLSRNHAADKADGERAYRRIADLALAGPGTAALRALMRVTDAEPDELIKPAERIGRAVVGIMGRPLNSALVLRERKAGATGTWVTALRYAAEHDLQAVLDEWLHLLAGQNANPAKIAEAVESATNIKPAQITVTDVAAWAKGRGKKGGKAEPSDFIMRGYFAMRLANSRGDGSGGGNRVAQVKDAFCSPFAPFVLTTTSIGQEGLDFHPYCHRVYHWNVPSNPVDLEQREGRVHRFKGHALRHNLVTAHCNALAAVHGTRPVDPWRVMFEAAEAAVNEGAREASGGTGGDADGRAPYWVLGGHTAVRRIALNPPFSRERARYKRVRRDLTTYRLAFGQARQADLLDHLGARLDAGDDTLDPAELERLQITLRPGSA